MNIKKVALVLLTVLISFNVFAQSKNKKSFKKDNILIEYVENNGGVLLYYVDDKNHKFSVLDTVDLGTSSFTGVLIDKNYFNLKTSGGVYSAHTVTEDSLAVKYTIGKKLEVTLTYTVPEKNVLNIKYTLKNLSKDEHTVAVKSIFDTCLGEWNGTPFSTEAKQKIQSEYIISNFQKHKTLTSTDGTTGIRFMMDKDFGNIAYKCVIAAKPYFENDNFDNHFIEGRGFNTVLSYNNACVGFFFKTRTLKAGKEVSFNQKVEFAQAVITSFKKPADDDDDDESKKYHFEGDDEESSDSKKTEDNKTEVIGSQEESKTETSTQPVKEFQNETEKESVTEAVSQKDEKPSIVNKESEENVFEKITAGSSQTEAAASKPKVNKERALEIINRIKNLEEDGSNTNRSEIIELQIELDEIIRCLK